MARILFTTHPASGHLRPLVPIALAARARGHEVAVVAPEVLAAEIAGYGLQHVVGGYDWRYEVYRMIAPGYRDLDFAAAAEAFRALGQPLTEAFAGHIARGTCADLLVAAQDWRADIIVRELDELGGYLAAEALDIPHVSIASFGGLDQVTGAKLGPILETGRTELGLPPDPTGSHLYRHLHVNLLPEQYSPAEMLLPNTRCYRHVSSEQSRGRLPGWMVELDHTRPFVFAGFGTVVYGLPGADTFVDEVVAALGEVDATVVLALGSGADLARITDVPNNVRLVDFVEQAMMLEGADLFVTHGGLNSMKEALRLAVPMVCVPPLDDHRHNGVQCERNGTARVVPLAHCTPTALADACTEVLTNPRYRIAARRMQRAIHALPPLDFLIDDLEQLAEESG